MVMRDWELGERNQVNHSTNQPLSFLIYRIMLRAVLSAYGLEEICSKIEMFGSGLINRTWKITTSDRQYILQRVNHTIFEKPDNIAYNIKKIAACLKQHSPGYHFVTPITSSDGEEMIYLEDEGFFRMFPFIEASYSKDVVETPEQAFEAATQFGKFTRLFSDFDVSQLKITIPHFHDLSLRYQHFLTALENGNGQRIAESEALVKL
jgi:Ser/Thr protein kinase RdoA (MazF antagonist)